MSPHDWANWQWNGHVTLLVLDDFQRRDKQPLQLFARAALGPDRSPVQRMPLAEMAEDIIASGREPAEKLLAKSPHVAANQRVQTSRIDDHVELTRRIP